MTVKTFRTKPVQIKAIQFTGDNHEELYEWTEGQWDDTHDSTDLYGDPVDFTARVYDILHETWISVAPGQWIVKGAKGEFYPCDNETFHWKYEEVTEQVVSTRTTTKYADGSSKTSFNPPVEVSVRCRYEGKHQGNVCFQEGDICSCGWTL